MSEAVINLVFGVLCFSSGVYGLYKGDRINTSRFSRPHTSRSDQRTDKWLGIAVVFALVGLGEIVNGLVQLS